MPQIKKQNFPNSSGSLRGAWEGLPAPKSHNFKKKSEFQDFKNTPKLHQTYIKNHEKPLTHNGKTAKINKKANIELND